MFCLCFHLHLCSKVAQQKNADRNLDDTTVIYSQMTYALWVRGMKYYLYTEQHQTIMGASELMNAEEGTFLQVFALYIKCFYFHMAV